MSTSTLTNTTLSNYSDIKEKVEKKPWIFRFFTMKRCVILSIPIALICICINIFYFTPTTSLDQFVQTITNYDSTNLHHYVVRDVKIPRMLAGYIVGASLAVGGAVMQGVTRNFLASPDVVGISDGANLGLAISLALSAGTSSYVNNIFFSMIGAGISTAIIFLLSSKIKGREGGIKLLLAGNALGMLFSSAASTINIWSGLGLTVQIWNNSGLLGVRWIGIGVMMLGVAGCLLAMAISGRITVLGMGDETAISLGQKIKLTKFLGIVSVVLISSATVCTVGNIGFVGLIIPNMVRMAVGADYKKVIPYSAFFGGILLSTADVISRFLRYPQPYETPIGTVTSIIGIPIFLYLVNGKHSKEAM